MRSRVIGTALVVLLALSGVLPSGPARAAELIQPGAQMLRPHGCTLNFVFEGQTRARKLYIGTAGHCVNGVGERVTMADGEIGTVAFRILEFPDDFALIEIDGALRELVSPEVRGLGGPSGSTDAGSTEVGDEVSLYGHGLVYGLTELTRGRPGVLTHDDAATWHAALPAIFGDSGGPVLHGSTGRALGVISGVSGDQTRPHTVNGTTVARALDLVAAAGLPVRLVTA